MDSISRRHVPLGSTPGVSESVGVGMGRESSRLSERIYKAVSEKIFIPMRDGVNLGANLVRPDRPDPKLKFPALLTYDPYRATEGDSLPLLGYYAEHGYYGVRVDLRGCGMSEGREVPNQYSEQERLDAEDIIAWLATQSWSNGNVGMFGTSYSGYNAIQMAMRNPPALKAIIPTFSADDVYTDCIIYYDGALQCEALARWPFFMIALSGLPGPPDYKYDTPEAQYRVEQEPWVFEMLRHQTADAFWQRLSLRPHYEAIKIPTMNIAGWLDQCTDSFSRMQQHLTVPTRSIVGPWTHGIGLPGPAINIQYESLRWWDRWLKGIDTGVTDEPPVAMYVNHSYKPGLDLKEIPGEWRYEDAWPVSRIKEISFIPQPDGILARKKAADMKRDLPYKPSVGMTNRYRCAHNAAELPIDQRADDDYSMCFDSDPLSEDMEILGHPRAELHVSCTAPVANWIVRLCDVAPDGSSTLVTKGILNGTHRVSHTDPTPLVPGEIYNLVIKLKVVSWVFPQGHRIRFAVSNADFPNLWPSPYSMTTSLYVDGQHESRFLLPSCPPEKRPAPSYQPPEIPAGTDRPAPRNKWTVTRDEMAHTVTVFRETVQFMGQGGQSTNIEQMERRWCTVNDADPAVVKVVAEGYTKIDVARGRLLCRSYMTIESDAQAFHVTVKRDLFVNDELKYGKSWEDLIPRYLV
jgi:putative CocE/NonD family hydrolase